MPLSGNETMYVQRHHEARSRNVFMYSAGYSCQILMELEFFDRKKKILKYEIS